ncbi:MAG: 2-amino-4-hydroxy-6-hydroxymethyldihydropteridine diphosphokinase [Planctomycetes bacterium]|nr:2-amino-4-hydroxy-6-hydroxymethyldihydropteridine diphosphokinase [Planctomycetota bacterium]MCH9726833.1 2-amino-4-hydroxy-6-hydroxymethyldihydropteridine diphosphokinase [Planctomycetota bacterium]MCH9775517.1 2-amino-4-hydroxy-6-hydroxymethyldihydropteridine diphosphokinase [Planctomycetota bacterium]MCH9791682.1 2-amino-4-hydroxy-6-hydroxymethyldihydropteridine diphosphokinase [Planctomycetota bacterium]
MPDCFIALGGNQGNVRETFSQALDRLNQHPEISLIRTSQWVETAPVGSQTDVTFLNGAAHLSVTLSPQNLLNELQKVETDMGRNRSVRWSARTLDLDLILYDQVISDSAGLVIPHPACWYRRFVLDPLREIAPDFVHPVKKITIKELQQRLLNKPFLFSIAGLPTEEAKSVIQELKPRFHDVLFSIWELSDQSSSDSEPTIITWFGSKHSKTAFHSLPVLPRLDCSEYLNNTGQIIHVLQSALDFH